MCDEDNNNSDCATTCEKVVRQVVVIGKNGCGGGKGYTGCPGDRGHTGCTGTRGLTGPTGPAGRDGSDDMTGPTGPVGPTGDSSGGLAGRVGSFLSVWNYFPLTYSVSTPNIDLIRISPLTLMSQILDLDSTLFQSNVSVPFYGPVVIYHPPPVGSPPTRVECILNITMNYVISSPVVTTGAVNIGLGLVDSTLPPLPPITRLAHSLAVFSNNTVLTQTIGMSCVADLPHGLPDQYFIPFIEIAVPGGRDNTGALNAYSLSLTVALI